MSKSMKSNYKMQNVSFKNVDDFLDFLPEGELKVVVLVRQLIFDCIPDIHEKLSYNVPFYKRNKSILFIWPSSILWGKSKSYAGVRIGFSQGHLIDDEIKFLNRGDRKQVCYKDYLNVSEIDVDLLKSYIFDALLIDNQFK